MLRTVPDSNVIHVLTGRGCTLQPPPPLSGPEEEGNMYDDSRWVVEPEEYIADMYDALDDDQQREGHVFRGGEANEDEEEVLGASAAATRSHNKDLESSMG